MGAAKQNASITQQAMMTVRSHRGRAAGSGRRAAAKQAYSLSAVDEYGKVIDDIYDFAEAQGFEIDGLMTCRNSLYSFRFTAS